MKTQISRDSYPGENRYSGVYLQQGRMITDADWNELVETIKHHLRQALGDAVASGAPRHGGLVVLDGFRLRPGRLYVDGVLAALPGQAPVPYAEQPDFPQAPPLPAEAAPAAGYRLYADVWERPVTALEDPGLLDPGLHGADTATRTHTMLQVKWCDPAVDPQDPDANPPQGDAPLTLTLWRARTAHDPCDPCAAEADVDAPVGNYLFRVEVHDLVRETDGALRLVLKWSSENGAEQYPAAHVPPGFDQGDWVWEAFDPVSERHLGVHLAPGFAPRRGLLLEDYPQPPPADRPFLRRWDGYCELRRDAGGGWTLMGGRDRGVDLATGLDADAHGHVALDDGLSANLATMVLRLPLEGRVFVAGDYWLAPVREAAHRPGDVLLEAAPPQGIRHHYLTLAEVTADGTVAAQDDARRRRLHFPPLTDLHARDVAFDDPCPAVFQHAENLQDALAALCRLDELEALRRHNQYLHGWGTVCGLQVLCDEDAPWRVRLLPGYALDCEGREIRLQAPTPVPLRKLLEAQGVERPEGDWCLSLSRDEAGRVRFHLDPEAAEETAHLLLDGTLLGRIWRQCLEPLLDRYREAFKDSPAVGWALRDLYWPRAGSGAERPFLTPREHQTLRRLYEILGEGQAHPTHCAAEEEAPPFPDYPYPEAPRIDGALGEAPLKRLRPAADGSRVYGLPESGALIHVLDAGELKFQEALPLPVQGEADLVDLALGADGALAVAVTREGGASAARYVLYRSDAIEQGGFRRLLETDKPITDIALAPGSQRLLYVQVRGEGLYRLHLDKPAFTQAPLAAYDARPGLHLTEDGRHAYALAQGDDGRLQILGHPLFLVPDAAADGEFLGYAHLTEALPLGVRIDLGPVTVDDFLVWQGRKVYVATAQADGVRQLAIYDAARQFTDPTLIPLGLGEVRLAAEPGSARLCLSRGALGQVSGLWWLDVKQDQWLPRRHLPLQLAPTALAAAGGQVFAAHRESRSLLRIPQALLDTLGEETAAQAYRTRLERYRDQVVAAFLQRLQQWLRLVWDCACLALLRDCPDCGEPPHKVPLAALTLGKDGVRRICNLRHRKYVMSFPTLGYWLSIVPLIPWLVDRVRRLCCLPEPGLHPLFPMEEGRPAGAGGLLTDLLVRPQAAALLETAPETLAAYAGGRLRGILAKMAQAQARGPLGARLNLAGRPVSEARERLRKEGVQVAGVVDLDSQGLPRGVALGDVLTAPLTLQPGERVTLYARDGRLAFYAPTEEAVPGGLAPEEGKARVLEADLGRLETRMGNLEARRAALADLQAEEQRLEALRQAREAEEKALAGLARQRAEMEAGLKTLKGELSALGRLHQEIRREITKDRPVREVLEIDPELDVRLREAGIRTVGELAAAQPARLRQAGLPAATARKLVQAAKARLG